MKFRNKQTIFLALLLLIVVSTSVSYKKFVDQEAEKNKKSESKNTQNYKEKNVIASAQEENKLEALFVGCNGFF